MGLTLAGATVAAAAMVVPGMMRPEWSDGLQNMLDAAGEREQSRWPVRIELEPNLKIQLVEGLVLRHPVHLNGNGSTLYVPEGEVGIHVHRGARRSTIEGFRIVGTRRSDGSGANGSVGVKITTSSVTMRDMRIESLDTGVQILGCTSRDCGGEDPTDRACTSDGDCPEHMQCSPTAGECRGSNANHTRSSDIKIAGCRRAAVIHGYDASHGYHEHWDVRGGESGILDSGFTGSTWVHVHIAGLDLTCEDHPPYADCMATCEPLTPRSVQRTCERTCNGDALAYCVNPPPSDSPLPYRWSFTMYDDTAYGMLVGAYVEAAPPVYMRGKNTLVLGQNAPIRLHPDSAGEVVGYQRGRMTFQAAAWDGLNGVPLRGAFQVRIPGGGLNSGTVNEAVAVDHPDMPGRWRLGRNQSGDWVLDQTASPRLRVFSINETARDAGPPDAGGDGG